MKKPFLFFVIALAFCLSGASDVYAASTASVVGNDLVIDTDGDTSFAVSIYSVDGNFWSHGRTTTQGNSSEFVFSGDTVTIQDAGRSLVDFQIYINSDPTHNLGYYISNFGDPVSSLSAPLLASGALASFYAETDASGYYSCVGPLDQVGTCSVPPSPTTPAPMTGFYENFDGASTTADTLLDDTWGQVGWYDVGSAYIRATSTASTSPNAVIRNSGGSGFYFLAATSTKKQLDLDLYMGDATDYTYVFQEGYAKSASLPYSSIASTTIRFCTRSSCDWGASDGIDIRSYANSCEYVIATTTADMSGHTHITVWEDSEEGYVIARWTNSYGAFVQASAICDVRGSTATGYLGFLPPALQGVVDNVQFRHNGDVIRPPNPYSAWTYATSTVFGYTDNYLSRFLSSSTIESVATGSIRAHIQYYLEPSELLPASSPNYYERFPQSVKFSWMYASSTATGTVPTNLYPGVVYPNATSTVVSGGFGSTSIDVHSLADGNYIANVQFTNWRCLIEQTSSGNTFDSQGIPVCPFPNAQLTMRFIVIDGVPYVFDVSAVDDTALFDSTSRDLFNQSPTDFVGNVALYFNDLIYNKQPFAWYVQAMDMIQQEAQYPRTEKQLDIDLPLFTWMQDATTSAQYSYAEGYAAYQSSGMIDSVSPIADGCSLLSHAGDGLGAEFCPAVRTFTFYAMWLALILFVLVLLRSFLAGYQTI